MRPLRQCLHLVYGGLGVLSLIVGAIGIIVPVLPTTPFVLLAAYLFSLSNSRLHGWLLRQPFLGPVILDWRRNRTISSKAKWAATILLGSSLLVTLCVAPLPLWTLSLIVAVTLGALSFVLTTNRAPQDL
jgi:uncharacterized membrane protein YbaN (DUF454 family)